MKYLYANWKMYLDVNESAQLAEGIEKIAPVPGYEVAVFPSALAFTRVLDMLKKSGIKVGAQNVAWVPKGAYTGAVSALLFKEAGASYALVGHSERRHIFGERSEAVRKKAEACLDAGLIPIICIGETPEDKEEDKRMYRLKKQLRTACEGLPESEKGYMVAYEPVWAVGTGNPCSPADAEDVIGWIKLELKNYTQKDVPVMYGGSVTPDNVCSYCSLESVDGVLVGSAMAKSESFEAMMKELRTICTV